MRTDSCLAWITKLESKPMPSHARKIIIILLSLSFAFTCLPAFGAIYLCGTIKGDATDDGYQDCINIDSFQDGVGRAIQLGGQASAPSFSEISLSKAMDRSSVPLRAEAAIGQFMDWTIHFVSAGNEGCEYYKVELTNARLSSHSMSSGGDLPFESLSISFEKVRYTYYPPEGPNQCGNPITWGYDLKTGTPL
jgi:type VI secretion system secreted protein Hcp